jgi:hypothetical protein
MQVTPRANWTHRRAGGDASRLLVIKALPVTDSTPSFPPKRPDTESKYTVMIINYQAFSVIYEESLT